MPRREGAGRPKLDDPKSNKVSKEVTNQIMSVVEETGYTPNYLAKNLRATSTKTIGVIVPHIRHPYFSELISNLENQAFKKGYKIILCNSQGKEKKEREQELIHVKKLVTDIEG